MQPARDDYDSPWKEAIETFLPDCLALVFPQAFSEVDWNKPFDFLDQELHQLQRDSEIGRQVVDKLVPVIRLDGTAAGVLIHVEVQSQVETECARRMFTYHYRLIDHFDLPIVGLAILGNESPSWRPDRYSTDLWGYGNQFTFRAVKLLDYRIDLTALEESRNPFTTIVLAHLRAQETRGNSLQRFAAKIAVLRRLYTHGYNREEIIGLYRFLDWLLALPPDLDRRFRVELRTIEETQGMPYVTSIERLSREDGLKEGLEKGRQQGERIGLLAGIELGLRLKFGAASMVTMAEIRQIEDVTMIQAIYDHVEAAKTIEELRGLYS